MATGDFFFSFSVFLRVSESTIYKIIKQTSKAIHKTLAPEYLKPPSSPEDWIKISNEFYDQWNMPNCVGALDGKHIRIKAPANSGSLYYNYKGYFSLVLLAMCDATYKFLLVDIGAFGSESDSGILMRSEMGTAIYGRTLKIPIERRLPGRNQNENMFIIGDSGFEMTTFVMRPYPKKVLNNNKKKIFNYRLSRARRTIENAFGILSARWGVLQKSIPLNPDDASTVTLATLVLHNFLLTFSKSSYCPNNFIDCETSDGTIRTGDWRNDVMPNSTFDDLENLPREENLSEAARIRKAYQMRDRLADYFVSPEGEVSWQEDYINRGKYSDDTHSS